MAAQSFDHRDNFFRMMRREQPTHLPLDIIAVQPVYETIREKTGLEDSAEALDTSIKHHYFPLPSEAAAWREAYATLGIALPDDAVVGYLGFTHRVPEGQENLETSSHLVEKLYPLAHVQSIAELEQLPWPDLTDTLFAESMERSFAQTKAAGRIAMMSMECTTFESAWYLRGMESVFMDLYEGSEVSQWLFDWFTHRSTVVCQQAVDAGVELIRLGDDIGSQHGMLMAPDMWREHLKPRLASVVRAIREREASGQHVYIGYHSDGDIRPVVKDLIEIGIELLNPVQPKCMPNEEVVSGYAERVGFWGMIGTQTTMPFGTPEEVRQRVCELVRYVQESGAVVIAAPTHVLEPDVPWENIQALTESIREQRLDHAVHLS